ncbi:MAG: PDZ domain-containing protein [Chitinophagaceae bacterium]|nr:PDZ domain-containing protein [Chitinophagaceae bacterium]
MKSKHFTFAFLGACFLLTGISLFAQREQKIRQNIILQSPANSSEKIVIVIDSGEVKINGKKAEELNQDISPEGVSSVSIINLPDSGKMIIINTKDNSFYTQKFPKLSELFDNRRAFLGVTTETVKEGVRINNVTDESAAEKAGLKPGDIIVKIDEEKISTPEQLSEIIRKHKPGDKVEITFIRDNKTQKVTATLSKFSEMEGISGSISIRGLNELPEFSIPIPPRPENFDMFNRMDVFYNARPRLGMTVRDTEEANGVEVIEVEKESQAEKAGIQQKDIITHVNDKEIKDVDEIARIIREKRNEKTVRFRVLRNGKVQLIEVKMPKKLKTTNL